MRSEVSKGLLDSQKALMPLSLSSEEVATFKTGSLTLEPLDLHTHFVPTVLSIVDFWVDTTLSLLLSETPSRLLRLNTELRDWLLPVTVLEEPLLFYAQLIWRTFLVQSISLTHLVSPESEIKLLPTGSKLLIPTFTVWSITPILSHIFHHQTSVFFTAAIRFGTKEEWFLTNFAILKQLHALIPSERQTTALMTTVLTITWNSTQFKAKWFRLWKLLKKVLSVWLKT